MKNLLKKLTVEQSLATIKILSLFLTVIIVFKLLADGQTPNEDKGVVYVDEEGKFHDFDSWNDFVKWTLQHKEKDQDFTLDYGDH